MSRCLGWKGAVLLALAPVLGGCMSADRRDWAASDSGSGGMFRAAWGGMRPDGVEASDTIRRIRGVEAPREPLQLEPGNVWPAEEAPRATLANPDAALRGVPPYRPGEARDPSRLRDGGGFDDGRSPRDPAFGGPRADAGPPPADLRSPPRRRGVPSAQTPQPLVQPEPQLLQPPPSPTAIAPPPPRSDGQVVLTPSGRPVVTTGGNDRIQGFTTPGGGPGGVIHRDGGVTTVVPSGGAPQTFPTPR